MEDNLKNEKYEYLNNHCSDLIQIWNLSLWDQAKFYRNFNKNEDNLSWKTTSHGRRPPEWKLGISQVQGTKPNVMED